LAFQGAAGYSGSLFFCPDDFGVDMRALIIFAGASLALSACGKSDEAGNTQNAADGLTAEKIVANDVTAIDAVTGDAANMAADMNYEELDENLGNAATTNSAGPSKPRTDSKAAAKKTEAPASNNTTADATTNSAD
jgi:hypothetical protein